MSGTFYPNLFSFLFSGKFLWNFFLHCLCSIKNPVWMTDLAVELGSRTSKYDSLFPTASPFSWIKTIMPNFAIRYFQWEIKVDCYIMKPAGCHESDSLDDNGKRMRSLSKNFSLNDWTLQWRYTDSKQTSSRDGHFSAAITSVKWTPLVFITPDMSTIIK